MATLNPNATVRHKRLATELRKLREVAKLDNQQAADLLGWSPSNLSKAETANRKPSAADVEKMTALYGCHESVALKLLKLAKNIGVRGWWVEYDDFLDPSFLELEDDAQEFRSWQLSTVPGLLQTNAYALALIEQGTGNESRHSQLRRAAARARRQERLQGDDAPVFHAVIEEHCLRRPVGGTDAMAAQLRALLDAAEEPNVTIQVMPQEAWEHPGHEGSFLIMGFGESVDRDSLDVVDHVSLDVVYQDGANGTAAYLESAAQVATSRLNFDRISQAALDQKRSRLLIEKILAKK